MHVAAVEAVNARVAGGERPMARHFEHVAEHVEEKRLDGPHGRVVMKGNYDHLLLW